MGLYGKAVNLLVPGEQALLDQLCILLEDFVIIQM
jgi:hypothetical protein